MCQAQPAEERSSAPSDGATPLRTVIAARGAALRGTRTWPAGRSGVAGHAAMLEAGAGQIADDAARGRVATLPLLLVAGPAEALVERPTCSRARPRIGHVRAPDERDVTILGPEIQRRDRRVLTSAAARAAALEAARIGPPNTSMSGDGLPRPASHRAILPAPRRRRRENTIRSGLRRGDPGVARSVRPPGGGLERHPRAVPPATSSAPARPSLDDDDLSASRLRLRRDRTQGNVEIRRPARVGMTIEAVG